MSLLSLAGPLGMAADFYKKAREAANAPIHPGSRSILGYRLPDIGVTELLAKEKDVPLDPQTGGSQLFGEYTQPPEYKSILGSNNTNTNNNVNNTSNTSSPTGQVKGVSTSGIPPVDMSFYQGWTDPNAIQADWAATWQQKTNQGGGSNGEPDYSPVFAELDRLAGMIPEQKAELENQVNQLFQTGKEGLGIQQEQSLSELGAAKEDVKRKQQESLRDLAQDFRNQLLAGQIYLGARGAGSSSATGRLSGALAKAANKNRAIIQAKANELWNEINLRENQVKNTFREQVNNLEKWKGEKMMEITQWANNILNQIPLERANVRKQAVDVAMQRLMQLDQQVKDYRTALEQWAMNRSENISQLKQNLQSLGQFNVGSMPQTYLPGISQGVPPTGLGGQYYSPMAQRREDEFLV